MSGEYEAIKRQIQDKLSILNYFTLEEMEERLVITRKVLRPYIPKLKQDDIILKISQIHFTCPKYPLIYSESSKYLEFYNIFKEISQESPLQILICDPYLLTGYFHNLLNFAPLFQVSPEIYPRILELLKDKEITFHPIPKYNKDRTETPEDFFPDVFIQEKTISTTPEKEIFYDSNLYVPDIEYLLVELYQLIYLNLYNFPLNEFGYIFIGLIQNRNLNYSRIFRLASGKGIMDQFKSFLYEFKDEYIPIRFFKDKKKDNVLFTSIIKNILNSRGI